MPPCVLVVEHDCNVRERLHQPLLRSGYTVVECESTPVALQYLCAAKEPHVVIVSRHRADDVVLANFLLSVCADEQLSYRHRFLCMSADSVQISSCLSNALVCVGAPWVVTVHTGMNLVVAMVATLAAQVAVPLHRPDV